MDEIGDNDLASIANCDRTIRVLAKGTPWDLERVRREDPLNIPIERRSPKTGLFIFLSYYSVNVPIAKPKTSLCQEYWCLEIFEHFEQERQ